MKALVTGAGGFLGRRLAHALRQDGRFAEVLTASRRAACDVSVDLALPGGAAYLFRACAPDVVFHLAANPLTRLAEGDQDGRSLWRDNVAATHNLLAAAPAGCRFVLASSAAVYGDLGLGRVCQEGDATVPTSVYGASKLAAEGLVHAFTSAGRVRGACLRLVATTGGGATHGLVPDVVRKLKGPAEALQLVGDCPGSVKPFLHANDAVSALSLLALGGATGNFNCSPDDHISVRQVARAVMRALGLSKPLVWLGASAGWPGDNHRVRVAPHRLRGLGWAPRLAGSAEAVAAAAREIAG